MKNDAPTPLYVRLDARASVTDSPANGTINLDLRLDVAPLLSLLRQQLILAPQSVPPASGPTLLEFVDSAVRDKRRQVGQHCRLNTWRKYLTLQRHLRLFTPDYAKDHNHSPADLTLANLTPAFVTAFARHLSHTLHLRPGTIRLYLSTFKALLRQAARRGLITIDPFADYRLPPPSRRYIHLSRHNLVSLAALPLTGCADHVRNLFLFSCYTGLAWRDLRDLTPDAVERDTAGGGWITTKRTKTGQPSTIRLLPPALRLLDTLPRHTDRAKGWLYVPDNRTVNRHLHTFADKLQLTQPLTFHVARHTFATLLLASGVSIETISVMLGHSRVTTTQIYAQVTRNKLLKEAPKMSLALRNIIPH